LKDFLSPEKSLFIGEESKGWACICGSTSIEFSYQIIANLIFDPEGLTDEVTGATCEATPLRCLICGEVEELFQFEPIKNGWSFKVKPTKQVEKVVEVEEVVQPWTIL